MTNSKQLAALIGPTMIALGSTEALNIDIFAQQIAPVVYLNGAILFVTGLALLQVHNSWSLHWTTLITVTAWLLLIGGLYRMIAPEGPQPAANALSYAIFAVIVVTGLFLTYKGYGPGDGPSLDNGSSS